MDSRPETDRIRDLKAVVSVCIALPVGLLHFITGPSYSGPFPGFVNGYLIDILLPFALYFLLCPQDNKVAWLKPWYVKALPVLAIGLSVETAQYVGINIFGDTFDPFDYAAYALGVFMAVVFDLFMFPLIFGFWRKGRAAK